MHIFKIVNLQELTFTTWHTVFTRHVFTPLGEIALAKMFGSTK